MLVLLTMGYENRGETSGPLGGAMRRQHRKRKWWAETPGSEWGPAVPVRRVRPRAPAPEFWVFLLREGSVQASVWIPDRGSWFARLCEPQCPLKGWVWRDPCLSPVPGEQHGRCVPVLVRG